MAVAEVSWEDSTGAVQNLSARLEDTSNSGACIRISTPISVGTRLSVEWREGRFSGTTKYCRSEGREYVIGIQREIPKDVTPASASHEPLKTKIHESDNDTLHTRSRKIQVPAEPAKEQSPNPEGRTSMLGKWLQLASGHDSSDSKVLNGNRKLKNESLDGNHPGTEPADTAPAKASLKDQVALLGDLLPVDDIYRAAGIVTLRTGYSINKVVEMLHSEHIRELSGEMKRASILMALDVAGIPVEEVLKDGKLRLNALDSYEVDQKKHLEEFEALKIQENAEIQLEIDRLKAHYLDRLQRNLDDISLVRTPLNNWQTMKQQEVQRISEAVKLCAKQAVTEPPTETLPKSQELVVAAKGLEFGKK